MAVPLKFMPCSTMSVINLMPTPSSRFFHIPFAAKPRLLRLYSANSSHTARPESSDFDSSSLENQGSNEKSEKSQAVSSNEILTRLKRYGISGVLAYGLLNTAYYLTTFLVVCISCAPVGSCTVQLVPPSVTPGFFSFLLHAALIIITSYKLADRLYVAPSPGRMGYAAAVERFLKVLAMVWAGSQVTKLMRAGGALALAPFVDRGLSWFTVKFGFESQGKAFMTIAGFCFGLAFMMFVVVTVLWA